MADIESNIRIDIDTSSALGSIKRLQSQISAFQKQMSRGSAASAANAQNLQRQLIGDINATGRFAASMKTIKSTTESFTNSLEKNKFSMGEYFRFAGASTKTFGKIFSSEFNTIEKVARERVKTLQTQYVSMGRDANGALQSIAVRPLTLDMNDLGTQTALAAQKQQLFNQLLKQGSTNLLNFGKNTQWAGRQLMVGFTIPLSIMGSMAAKEFRKLEEQAIKFRRVYGDLFTTPEQTDQALEDMRTLAKEFTSLGVAVEDTIALAAKVAQMGNTGAMLRAQVTEATRLSILGGMEQEAALDTTIGLTNAFGVSVEDLTDKVNFLNAAENQTILSIQDFNEAVPRAGSVVKQLGGDVEDLALFLTAMREGGVEASQGANALKSSLGRLINPTDAAKKRLGGFGIDIVKIVNSNVGDLRGTVLALGDELDKLDPLSRARAIETLFGKFQFARMATLFNNIQREGSQAARVLDIIGLSAEEMGSIATRELGRVEESVSTKFQKSLEQFKVAIAPIGEEFLKLATPIVEFGSKVLDTFNNLDSGAKSFIVGTIGVLGGIAPILLMLIGLVANFAANALKLFGNMRMLFLRLTGGSQMLTEQTTYMNQEQLEAAAVAASLDQTHSKLIQTFNVEAAAIDRLSAAYNKMVAAQARSMGTAVPTTVGGRKPRKMKDGGVVSVPGPKGAGDIVPAMLTPGEAVIPAEMVQKYGGLIQGMISDSIPGFNQGTPKIGRGRQGAKGKSQLTTALRTKDNIGGAVTPDSFGMIDPTDKMQVQFAYAEDTMREYGISLSAIVKETDAWRIENKQLIDEAVADFRKSGDHTKSFEKINKKYTSDMKKAGGETQKFLNVSSKAYPAMAKDLREAQRVVKKYKLDLSKGADTTRLAELLPDNKAAKLMSTPTGMSKGQGGRGFQDISKPRQALVSTIGGTGRFSETGIPNNLLASRGQAPEDLRIEAMSQEHHNKTAQQELEALRLKGERAKKKENIDNATAKKEQIAAKKKNAAADKELKNANASTVTTKKKKAAATKAEQAANTDLKTANRSAAARKGWETRRQRQSQALDSETATPGGVGAIAAPVANTTQRLQKMNGALMGASFALTSLAGVGSMMGGAIGELSQKIFAFSGVLFALMQVTQLLTQAKFLEVTATRFKVAKEAAFGSVVGPKTAAQAATGFGASLARATTFVARFIGPIGIAIGALTALGFGIKFVLDKQKEQRQEIEGLGKTANLAEKQLKSLGELFGVTARSADFSSRFEQPAGTAEQVSLTQQVLETENFSEDFGTQITAIENATKDRAEIALRSLSLQLASSGFATEQVEAIIRAIATEAKRKDLDLSFAGIEIDFEQVGGEISGVVNDAIAEFNNALEQPGAVTSTSFSSDVLQSAEMLAGVYTTSFGSLALGLEDGKVSAEEFNDSISEIVSELLGLDKVQLVIPNILENLEIDEDMSGLKNIEDQLTVIQAAASGVNVSEMITDLQRLREEEDAMANKTGPEAESQLGRIRLERSRITAGIGAQAKATEELRLEEARQLTDSDIGTAIDSNRERLEVFNQLIKAGFDEAEALEMSNDEKWRALTLEAMEKDLLPDLITLREDYNDSIESLPESQNRATVALQASIEELEKQSEVYDWLISQGFNVSDAQRIIGDSALYAAAAETMLADSSIDMQNSLPIPQEIWEVADAIGGYAGAAMKAAAAEALSADAVDKFKERFNSLTELQGRLDFGSLLEGRDREEETPSDKALSSLRDQKKEIINSKKAYNGLVQSGMDAAKAFQLAQDPINAAALASQEVDSEGWNQLYKELVLVNGMLEKKGIQELMQSTLQSLEDQKQEILDSRKVYDGLRQSGVDIATAFELASDPIMTAALASQEVGSEGWNQLYNGMVLVNEMMERKGIQDLIKTRSADIELTGAFANISPTLSKMGLSAQQISEILSNKGLAKEFIKDLKDGEISSKLIRDYLNQIDIQEKIDLKIQLSTPEGIQEWLNDYSGAVSSATSIATEFFEAQRSIADQDFMSGTNVGGRNEDLINISDIQDEIEESTLKLDEYRFDMGNLEYDLSSITDQEEEINKKYDERLDALNKILEANSDIAEQQESQLDIATALSSGDVAAAAKAVQQERIRATQKERETRQSAIEKQRERELQDLRSASGKTRKQLEDEILDLQKKIRKEEGESLAPSQRRLEIAEGLRDTALEAIGEDGYLGKTEQGWKAIEGAARLAVVQSDAFKKSLIDIIKAIPGMSFDADGKLTFNAEEFKSKIGAEIETGVEDPPPTDPTTTGPTPTVKTSVYQAQGVKVLDRDTAAKAAISAVKTGKATDPLAFANQVRDQVLANRAAVRDSSSTISDAERKRLTQENINLMQTTGLKFARGGMVPAYLRMGGLLPYKSEGGSIFKPLGTDTVPAMLTPGEFVVRKYAVDNFGVDRLSAINSGTYNGESVYNYNLSVNVKSEANPNEIAKTVMTQIRQVDSMRLRGNRF